MVPRHLQPLHQVEAAAQRRAVGHPGLLEAGGSQEQMRLVRALVALPSAQELWALTARWLGSQGPYPT